VTRYVQERRAAFGVEPICRAIGVSVSTYYARRSRKPSNRELEDRRLIAEIQLAREGYRRVYGVRKTWKQLRRHGVDVGRDRVARLMRREGLEGTRRGKKRRTTIADEAAIERARDLLQRDFAASRPNEKWVADVSYLRSWSGFVYLAFILDCYGRMIVGWQLATHLRTELVMDALEMAIGLRKPAAGLIAHSDRGSQYTSLAYTDRLDELRIAPSVGSRGDAYDNAMAEALDRHLQDRARRRPPLPQLRARRARGPALDRLLQRGETARGTRRLAARRVRGIDYQDRQHPNTVDQITEPPRNPGRITK
jgi:putative transposase